MEDRESTVLIREIAAVWVVYSPLHFDELTLR